jgi:hypothetical protein
LLFRRGGNFDPVNGSGCLGGTNLLAVLLSRMEDSSVQTFDTKLRGSLVRESMILIVSVQITFKHVMPNEILFLSLS